VYLHLGRIVHLALANAFVALCLHVHLFHFHSWVDGVHLYAS
jgi:hypothetical protein